MFWPTGEGTSTGLFRVSVESGAAITASAPGGRNSAWSLSEDGTRWVWVHTSPGRPGEIYTATTDGEPVRLTDANAWLREEDVQLGTVETVRWTNSDGDPVEGVLTKPVGYEEGVAYPFIVNPHGGPTGASLAAFNATTQFFAGNGYVVLQPNFRGSTNYGQAFVSANIDNWGITDYDDVMTGVDHAIEMGWADPERLICYGWSYGGYLSAWIVTQTDRFQAVSPGAGLTNLYSMYSTNDIQDYLASFFGGTPWTATDNYREHSPMTYVADVKSPVLLMHGGQRHAGCRPSSRWSSTGRCAISARTSRSCASRARATASSSRCTRWIGCGATPRSSANTWTTRRSARISRTRRNRRKPKTTRDNDHTRRNRRKPKTTRDNDA